MSRKKFHGDRPPGDPNEKPPAMEDGKIYEFNPPIEVNGKFFTKARCDYRVPAHPNEYAMTGMPVGELEEMSFVLHFTDKGTRVSMAPEQNLGVISFTSRAPKNGLPN